MTTLYEFRGAADGRGPKGNLIFDAAGNLYGTTLYTGKTEYCCGTVFELTPTASGPWKQTTLYSFKGGDDGGVPNGSGLVFDNAGNLYGTTSEYGQGGYGTVFELSPTATGGWTQTVLYSFRGGSDGAAPESGLVFDKVGNLYGETPAGGGKTNGACIYGGCGTIFELTPGSDGWTENLLYSFSGGTDGGGPAGGLDMDAAGNLYGAASFGANSSCPSGCGAAFELSPGTGGTWTESVLYAFSGRDGSNPLGPLILSRDGDLYGATETGGPTCNCGTVFELSPNSEGGWNQNILYAFTGGSDGLYPQTGLVEDKTGSFYGATYEGGAYNMGTIFKIFP